MAALTVVRQGAHGGANVRFGPEADMEADCSVPSSSEHEADIWVVIAHQ
jgi:hypothetical protein